jgi:hypothetical protein
MSTEPIAKHTIIGEPFAFGREFMGFGNCFSDRYVNQLI